MSLKPIQSHLSDEQVREVIQRDAAKFSQMDVKDFEKILMHTEPAATTRYIGMSKY